MKNKMTFYGMIILIGLFVSFYFITSLILDNLKRDEEIVDDIPAVDKIDKDYNVEKEIVTDLYNDVRMLYDVVNSKFKVSQDDTIVINNITYKKITNFNEITNHLFTDNGLSKYISDLGSYFGYTNNEYYLAGNLVSYQTYYFRGDNTNIYVQNVTNDTIDAIIYEKWTSNNKNTLATIRVVNENNEWLIDNISILASE